MADLRYPIGTFNFEMKITDEKRRRFIDEIERAPARLRAAVNGLSEAQIDTPYRPEGWTVRQVVHHVPESHMNSYIRMKLALTEDVPTIRPYYEDRWSEIAESRTAPVEVSLALLDALHERWVLMLRTLTPDQYARTFNHPEIGILSIDTTIALYAWHGNHHTAHITSLRERMGW